MIPNVRLVLAGYSWLPNAEDDGDYTMKANGIEYWIDEDGVWRHQNDGNGDGIKLKESTINRLDGRLVDMAKAHHSALGKALAEVG